MSYSQKFVNGQIEQNVARFAYGNILGMANRHILFLKTPHRKEGLKIYTNVKHEVRRNVPNLIKVNPAYGDVIIKTKIFKRRVFPSLADCSSRNR
jgi:hypothetical protein